MTRRLWHSAFFSLTLLAAGLGCLWITRKWTPLVPFKNTQASTEIHAKRALKSASSPSKKKAARLVHNPLTPDERLHAPLPKRLTAKEIKAMPLQFLESQKRCIYTFHGVAKYRNKPCASAHVVVRIRSGDDMQAAEGITNSDGAYTLSIPVLSKANELVEWTIEAHTPEFNKVELTGRRIATEDTANAVTLDSAVAFLPETIE